MAASPLTIVAAVASNGVIGHQGQLPWRLSADLKHFKALTLGHIVVMGRKTFESLPAGPLAGRCNVVLSRGAPASPSWQQTLSNWQPSEAACVVHCNDLNELQRIQQIPHQASWFVIGGQQIYECFLPYASNLALTYVDLQPEGDAFFPAWDRQAFFETSRRHYPATDETPAHDFVFYRRHHTD